MKPNRPLWTPSQQRIEDANVTRFARDAIRRWKLGFNTYPDFYRWTVEHAEQFWQSVWEFGGVRGEMGPGVLLDADRMPGAQWFPDARLNFAENLLRRRDDGDALVFWGEDKVKRRLSHRELYDGVSRLAQALRAQGVEPGDRVAAYLPNMPEAIVGMLAAASIGAIWSSCSPDFGVQGVLDRFGQIEPKVLFAVDGYCYNGKTVDCLEKLREIAREAADASSAWWWCPTSRPRPTSSAVPHGTTLARRSSRPMRRATSTSSACRSTIRSTSCTRRAPPACRSASCTAPAARCCSTSRSTSCTRDVKPGDRLFYFTTCGWMMWNWLVSGLAAGATLLLYDGSPFVGRGAILFDFADAERMTHFGTSAKFIDAIAKAGLEPRRRTRLDAPARDALDRLAAGAGELRLRLPQRQAATSACRRSRAAPTSSPASCSASRSCRCGAARSRRAASAWRSRCSTSDGRPVRGEKGELVCTRPFPSMPVGFWNDPDGAKYRAAYFERFPERLVPRRLRRADRARRHDHLRPLRRGAQSGRRAHRHGRDLPPGRAACPRWSSRS